MVQFGGSAMWYSLEVQLEVQLGCSVRMFSLEVHFGGSVRRFSLEVQL